MTTTKKKAEHTGGANRAGHTPYKLKRFHPLSNPCIVRGEERIAQGYDNKEIKRVIACANACEGMDCPAEAIEGLKAAVKAFLEFAPKTFTTQKEGMAAGMMVRRQAETALKAAGAL